ncbi:hypothetical protein FHS19_005433 [Paenibacillus rhizosphaerae]|uniref:Copper amine oxidase-like N-terminal domain-containing protein n=1 Tax=Paenibacillus rhizosphaerae TaxID=297318 RepID=A0A839TUA7_9BACL|nr:stalk domain-containing protein [Paenibacillus rhizosphaerae]MBB3130714.1 hypothetical protein [Paenibacillus rhizosphaerae]
MSKLWMRAGAVTVLAAAAWSLSIAAYSSDTLQVKPVQPRLVFNGEEAKGGTGPMFSYRDSTYVPLRDVSTAMGAEVSYDKEFNTVHVDTPVPVTGKSKVHASKTLGDFRLSIYASETEVPYGEPVPVWAQLEYLGEKDAVVNQGFKPFYFEIRNEAGEGGGALIPAILIPTTYSPGDVFLDQLDSSNDIPNYNFTLYQKEHPNEELPAQMLKDTRWSTLPSGKYTISAGASFSLESTGESIEGSAEIQITVK